MAPEADPGKTNLALSLIAALRSAGQRVGVFRPLIPATGPDQALTAMLQAAGAGQSYDQGYGVTYAAVHQDPDEAVTTVIDRYGRLGGNWDTVVILGSDFSDVIAPVEFDLNADLAAHLNAPALLVLAARDRIAQDLRHGVTFCLREIESHHGQPLGVVVTDPDDATRVEAAQALAGLDLPVALLLPDCLPTTPLPAGVIEAIADAEAQVRTPLHFQAELTDRARSDLRTIVLPETDDDRILLAADRILDRGLAHLILLGDQAVIGARAAELGLDLSRAKIQDPADPLLTEKFAREYTKLRAHKGVTIDQARETFRDLSYFGTMMIYFGLADGMVSGACHTTANTIRPSLEFIKTKPGVALVSGYFLMCLPDRVLVFADCAVTIDPTPGQLSDIALASAQTAVSFGIEPRVALLSYSTGRSGSGAAVDAVREATLLLQERAPELPVAGPIQFDAAIDPEVARVKAPDSPVAGRATVFVFPDLNTGNITYKAVQRTAHTLALGPILQGLRKPVNDLSRGALVDDIVNTVAITAIQAQADPGVPF